MSTGVSGRTVYITGAIDDAMLECRREIHKLAREGVGEPIDLLINSQGGSVIGAFAVLDELELVRSTTGVTFLGIVQGQASSAALTLLQGCDRRIAGSHSILMLHGISCNASLGDLQRMGANSRFMSILVERQARLYSRRSRLTCGEYLDLFQSDVPTWYSPAQALEAGLIDEIVGTH